MTTMEIEPGICGLPSVITATAKDDKRFAVRVDSPCPMVMAMQEDLIELGWKDLFKGFSDNPVYLSAAKSLRHPSCPVPCGILKTLEVEAQTALPKDVHLLFR